MGGCGLVGLKSEGLMDEYTGAQALLNKRLSCSSCCSPLEWTQEPNGIQVSDANISHQYFNDTQEIDMEFLSKDFRTENSSYPVNLVLQSPAAAQAGFDASGTDSHKVVYLPFNPSADFHEYRLDFVPGRVAFYADGAVLAVMDDPAAVPTTAGHLALNQWSNGNALWSGGPPAEDAVMDVRYVKAYFNSSLKARQGDYAARCKDPAAAGAVCAIPAVTADNDSAAGYFFTGQKNMTDNQTVSSDNGVSGGDENGAIERLGLQYFTWMWVAVSVLMTGCGVLL